MSEPRTPMTCEEFESRVSDYLECTLPARERTTMDIHLQQCAACALLVTDIEAIVREAGTLPLLAPSHDLWEGIAEQIEAPMLALGAVRAPQPAAVGRVHTVSARWLAIAATVLVAVSSGVTYVLARNAPLDKGASLAASAVTPTGGSTRGSPPAPHSLLDSATNTASAAGVRSVAAERDGAAAGGRALGQGVRGAAAPARYATRSTAGGGAATLGTLSSGSVEFVYEREFTAMRRIVNERLGDLDSATVVEIERNLAIIDKAISDSRRALRADPHSRFLSAQLDRALENKLDILRRVALL